MCVEWLTELSEFWQHYGQSWDKDVQLLSDIDHTILSGELFQVKDVGQCL
jgi:hypothetical protein